MQTARIILLSDVAGCVRDLRLSDIYGCYLTVGLASEEQPAANEPKNDGNKQPHAALWCPCASRDSSEQKEHRQRSDDVLGQHLIAR